MREFPFSSTSTLLGPQSPFTVEIQKRSAPSAPGPMEVNFELMNGSLVLGLRNTLRLPRLQVFWMALGITTSPGP